MKKLFIFLTALLIIGLAYSEVTLLFDDFENMSNNWTFVNGTQINKWVIGSQATDNETHSIYISNSPDGTENPAHAYTLTPNRNNVYFYQDITFPENAIYITLSFDFFTGLQTSGMNFMEVYLPETSYVPEANTGPIPTVPNRIGRSRYNSGYDLSYYTGGYWTNYSIDIPTDLATGQTKRLLFLWTSTWGGTAQYNREPVALDNIKITYTEKQPYPAKVVNLKPNNNAENRTVSQRLHWYLEGTTPTGYYIYIDTYNPPTTMYDVVGDFSNFRPDPALEWGTKYYWRVVPYNEHGYTESDTVWSFSTRQDPTITEYPYLEDFDRSPIYSYSFPTGWEIAANPEYFDFLPWMGSTTGSYSYPNFIAFLGHNNPAAEYTTIISTPPIQNITEKRLVFYASAQIDGVALRVGTMKWQDDTDSFVAIDTIHLTTKYEQYIVNLSDAVGDYVAFSNLFDSTISQPTFLKRIDHVLIENNPVNENSSVTLPIVTELKGNYPNPFNPETIIEFSLDKKTDIRIDVYNIRGQRVKTLLNSVVDKGEHSVLWNGTDDNELAVSSGVYFYRMMTDDYSQTKRMLLLK